MGSDGFSTPASTATNSSSSSRRTSISASADTVSPFQSWLIARQATQLIPRPLAEIEAVFTPLTHFYPVHWTHAPFCKKLTHEMLAAAQDPTARPAQIAAKLRECAQLGKLLWNLSNAHAAKLLLGLDEIVGCQVLRVHVVEDCLGNGSCDFYPEMRLEMGLAGLDRKAWMEWWERREAWVRERRGRSSNWDAAVVKVLRELAERRESVMKYRAFGT